MVVSLWMLVVSLLFAFWVFLFDASRAQLLPYQAGEVDLGVAGLLPLVMLSAIIVGYVFIGVESFKPYQRYLSKLQIKVARLFEMVYVLIPGLVFFVVLNFMKFFLKSVNIVDTIIYSNSNCNCRNCNRHHI